MRPAELDPRPQPQREMLTVAVDASLVTDPRLDQSPIGRPVSRARVSLSTLAWLKAGSFFVTCS